MNNIAIQSTASSMDILLEVFFRVQPQEHVKAWRWHQFTKNYDQSATDAALRDGLKVLREKRYEY